MLTSFNRTFMELKLGQMERIKTKMDSFNRTFMELKYACALSSVQPDGF